MNFKLHDANKPRAEIHRPEAVFLSVQLAQFDFDDLGRAFLRLKARPGEEAVCMAVQARGFDLFDLGGDHGFGDGSFSEFGFDISMSSERVCKCQTFAL